VTKGLPIRKMKAYLLIFHLQK